MGRSMTPPGLKSLDITTKPRFRWDKADTLKSLVQSMLSYKSEMEHNARTTAYKCKHSNIRNCINNCIKQLLII